MFDNTSSARIFDSLDFSKDFMAFFVSFVESVSLLLKRFSVLLTKYSFKLEFKAKAINEPNFLIKSKKRLFLI